MPKIIGFAGGAFINVDQGAAGPAFIGPAISDLNLTQNQVMAPIDFSPLFTGGVTFALIGGSVPGLSLSSGGVLSGTPTTLGSTGGLLIRASDGANPDADSNTFAININAAVSGVGMKIWRRQSPRRFTYI